MRLSCTGTIVALVCAAGAARAEDVENPEFTSWSKFKKGASITLKSTAKTADSQIEGSKTITLVEVKADKIVLEVTEVSKIAGSDFRLPPSKRDVPKTIELPFGDKKEDFLRGKPSDTAEEGTEVLKVAGTEIKTKRYKTREIPPGIVKTKWMSEDVPGGLVKEVTISKGMKNNPKEMTTWIVELTELKK